MLFKVKCPSHGLPGTSLSSPDNSKALLGEDIFCRMKNSIGTDRTCFLRAMENKKAVLQRWCGYIPETRGDFPGIPKLIAEILGEFNKKI